MGDISFGFGDTVTMLKDAGRGASMTHEVIANNIANINTPNFKRSDVSFKEALARELPRTDDPDELALVTDDPKQIPAGPEFEAEPFAVTTTWWCNRQFTFRDHVRAPMLRQWAHFVAVNLTGAAAQYATYATLVACLGLCRTYPEIAVAAGAVTGMMFNFGFARRFVFKR